MLSSIMILIIVNSHRTGMNCTACVCVNHVLMDFSRLICNNKFGMVHYIYPGSHVCIFFSGDSFCLGKQCRP